MQSYAEELFREISPKLKPQVFLLGILRESREVDYVCYPICIQPEDCGIDVTLFDKVDSLAHSIWEKDNRRSRFFGMPYIHENYHEQIKRDSIRSAIQKLVDENFKEKNIMSFVSNSVFLEGYEIFVVLQFEKEMYNSLYGIKPTSNSWRHSLLDSLIRAFLAESLDTMYRPRAHTAPQSITMDRREIMRVAASLFVSDVVFTVCESYNSREFLSTCNYVSSLTYEGDSSVGKMIICQESHPNLELSLKLNTPVRLSEYRKIRKLLEIAARDLALYSNGLEILGLGKIKGEYDENKQNLIRINFIGYYKWELVHGKETMLIVEHTNPRLPNSKVNKEIFSDLLKRIFTNVTNTDIDNLYIIVSTATTQKHGALLVISNEAEQESFRLANQSTTIEPMTLDESLIRNITSIDGAVMLDSHGICYSFGAILDGVATKKGTAARGARYNSAVRYVENNKKKCIAVIISEDGTVDLYPQLLPKIKRRTIEEYLDRLKVQSQNKILDSEEYHNIMYWFDEHRFYLSQKQCNEINSYKKICHSKQQSDPYRIFILWSDFAPNPEMDCSYFENE